MAKTIDTQQVRYIQRMRHALKVDDETFSEMKRSVGVESTRDLTVPQWIDLVGRLKSATPVEATGKAWKPLHRSAAKSGMARRPPGDKEAMIRKIEAILAELALSWAYADGMAKKMFGVSMLRFCDAEQTYKLLQALAVHQRRKNGGSDGDKK